MKDPLTQQESGLFSPRKIAIQLTGFAVGLALLGWCIHGAVREGDWGRLADADPLLVLAMLACTLISAMANGSTFWITIRPLRRLRWWDLQCLNLLANMLNYAPVRLGAIVRYLYHFRVDRIGLLQLAAWFVFVGYLLMLGVGSCIVATIAHPHIDVIWVALVLGQMILGGLVTRVLAAHPIIARHGRGIDRMVEDRGALWGGIALRLLDLAAFSGRMAAAMAILEIMLPASHVILLGIVAMAASLIPFGRLGFREFCVAMAAERLGRLESEVSTSMEQLALVESAGEAIIFIPLGSLAILWFRKRWRAAGGEV